MKKGFLLLGCSIYCCLVLAQSIPRLNKYWVEFTDKFDSPYCTCRPAEFLSLHALARRDRAGIAVVENDLPVNPAYVSALLAKGVQLHGTSRWLNAATVTGDSATASRLAALPFVKSVRYIGRHLKYRNPPNQPAKKRKPQPDYPQPGGTDNPLGYASRQNDLLGLPPLYAAGHRGAGIRIAVLDGGFTNVDTLPFFDSIALQGRLIVGQDLVERDAGLFEAAQHGTSVLSVMAANLPGYFIGTAPDATYYLLKTEDTGGEYPVEEANWIAGAEWADSAGVDIINASLGYTHFTDTTLNHRYVNLDGRTAIASRGAVIAATKGMIICNSAGNEGDGSWHFIGVPADAPGLIAVGAVDYDGQRAAFSSFGPTPDGRIKPDLVAPGEQVVTAGNKGTELGLSSGTSLASPMLAGAIASLWSAYPDKTATDILDAVFQSADQAGRPDNERGFGLPDMTTAWLRLGGFTGGHSTFAFDRAAGELTLLLADSDRARGFRVELQDVYGRSVGYFPATFTKQAIATLKVTGLAQVPAGPYQLVWQDRQQLERKIVLLGR